MQPSRVLIHCHYHSNNFKPFTNHVIDELLFNDHFSIQYRVARRGVEMLTIDGKMVYSTCSLNPIEDEAVLHRLLVEAKGSLELVDVAHKLPGLKYVKGLSHWVVMNRDLTVYEKPEDVPDAIKNLIRPNIFPPTAEDAKQFHFDRW